MWPLDTGSTRKCSWTRARRPRPSFSLSQDCSTAGGTSWLLTHVPRGEAGQMNAPPPPTGPAEEAASHGLPGPRAPPTSVTSCSWTLQPFPLTPSSAPHSSGRKGTLAVGWQKDHLQRSCELPGKAQPVQREATCWGLRVQSHQHPQQHWAPPPRPACSPPLCAVNSLWCLHVLALWGSLTGEGPGAGPIGKAIRPAPW